jgi:hypothetical protein
MLALRGWRQMEHLREWRSRKVGSADPSLRLRRDFFFASRRGFGVVGAESSSSLAIGVLQRGEGEAIVAISLKVSFHISLLAQRATRETKKQLNESTVEGQL